MPRKLHLGISFSNYSKSKIRKEKMPERKKHITCRGAKVRVTLNFSSETMQRRRE